MKHLDLEKAADAATVIEFIIQMVVVMLDFLTQALLLSPFEVTILTFLILIFIILMVIAFYVRRIAQYTHPRSFNWKIM